MGDIKCLPEDIRNSVRSAIILFDLTRIVEELIFNSLDAGATKISVAVGAEACYVKVVDNGCGITRDGLVLLAERYASSKFDELADSHAVARSFGFRGEALSSIANVSLLEVLTKAHGRPNGYRKIMKGCKCLYIGIDDGRKDVGTTVIVRDLFYNQPVRRKLMHSSPKKELESVKKCVLRISLVHQTVSFKVVDIESDDELFCASPSSSPLSRLTSGFGVEVANSLHELNATNGELKLSGYMSNPRDISSAKAFQYIYINSRYISKGTIHKLLNQLTSTINFLQHQKVNEVSPIAKRSKIQICFSFILNLCCPRSWYDLSFEPSKTSVDFKDWKPIIDFIEKSITCFWSKFVSHGEALNDGTGVHVPTDKVEIEAAHTSSPGKDFPAKCRTNKRKNRLQNHTSPIAFPSPYLEKQSKNYDYLDCLKEHKIFGHDITYRKDSSFNYFDESPAMSWAAVDQEIGSCDYGADYNVFSTEYQLVVSKSFVPEKYKKQTEYISEFGFDEEHFKMEATLTNGYLKANIPSDSFGIDNMKITSKTFEKPFLKSCRSSKRRVLYEESHFRSEGLDESLPNKYFNNDIASDPFEIGNLANMHNFVEKPFIRSCRTQKRQILDEESLIRSEEFDFPIENFRCKRTCNMPSELNFPSENPIKSYLIGGDLHTENGLLEEIVPVFGSKSRFEYDFDENPWRGYESSTKCNYLAERGNLDLNFYSDDIVSRSISSREYCNLFKGDGTYSGYKKYAPTEKDSYGFQPQHKKYVAFPTSSDMFINEKKLLSSDLYCEDDGYCCPITSHLKVNNDKDHKYIKESLSKPRPRRSHSAPPFFRGKKVFVSSYFLAVEKKGKKLSVDGPEADELKHPKKSIAVSPLDSESNSRKDLLVYTREIIKGPNTCGIERVKEKEPLEDLQLNCTDLIEENQDLVVPDLKWQQGYTKTKNEIKSYNSQNEDKILDVSSALLRLAGDSLIPESINKNFLKDAKVLQQVDKKFIPVVANGVLAIIDQHAADERIRLEELRQKVLLGEKKTITYLDTEQKLVMPEMGYQLLHTYAEQIEKWGWLCDIHSQDSRSFKKSLNILHKKRKGFTLIAVPCILGVNLTDVDLLEFLQQLADTDGSSTIPPSVNRILNSKACRGAIMFGDTLLPSECSLIVEELKQTSLCFQCAHGRPTTVPVINLEALHKQIAKLKSWNKNSDMWHGLRRNIPSLEWATNRLSPAEV